VSARQKSGIRRHTVTPARSRAVDTSHSFGRSLAVLTARPLSRGFAGGSETSMLREQCDLGDLRVAWLGPLRAEIRNLAPALTRGGFCPELGCQRPSPLGPALNPPPPTARTPKVLAVQPCSPGNPCPIRAQIPCGEEIRGQSGVRQRPVNPSRELPGYSRGWITRLSLRVGSARESSRCGAVAERVESRASGDGADTKFLQTPRGARAPSADLGSQQAQPRNAEVPRCCSATSTFATPGEPC